MSWRRDLAEDTVIADAARTRGLTLEQFEATELASRIQPVGPHDAETVVASSQEQMQGRPFEEMDSAIGCSRISRRSNWST